MSELVHIQASYISLFTVAFLLVVARVFVKVKIVHNLGLEDYACIFALVCAINSTYFFCREASLADEGYDLSQVGINRLSERLKSVYACWITYNLSVIAVKYSFLLQYLRIFHYKSMRIAIWTVSGIVTVVSLWSFLSSIFICWPPELFWSLSLGRAREDCLDLEKYYISHAGLSVGTDILILLLPIPGLKRLMLPRSQKTGLILVFLLGGLICVASILRLSAFIESFDGSLNLEWGGFSVGVWTAIEMNTAIICCCLPPLRPAIARLWSRIEASKGMNRARNYLSGLFGTMLSSTTTTAPATATTSSSATGKSQDSPDSKESKDSEEGRRVAVPMSLSLTSASVVGHLASDEKRSGNKTSMSWLSVGKTSYAGSEEARNEQTSERDWNRLGSAV